MNSVCFHMEFLRDIISIDNKLNNCYGCFYSIINYGIILWGSSPAAERNFEVQKRIRILSGKSNRDSCRLIFRNLKILILPSIFLVHLLFCVKKNISLSVSTEVRMLNIIAALETITFQYIIPTKLVMLTRSVK